jgi:hypothetical protein
MSHTITGSETGTCVDIELMGNGSVEICTDEPRSCCVAVVQLDDIQVKELIRVLQLSIIPQK